MIKPINRTNAQAVPTPARLSAPDAAPCSAPSGEGGAARTTEALHINDDKTMMIHVETVDNDVKCTNIPVTSVESVVMKHGVILDSVHDETSSVNEISTAENVGLSDRTSEDGPARPSGVHETSGEAATTAGSHVARSASLRPALTANEGGANALPQLESGSDGIAGEVLLPKENTFPRDSAKVLTRAEARKKYGKLLSRKWDFDTIPHDEIEVIRNKRRRTDKLYKEQDLQEAVRKRHGLPIYSFMGAPNNSKGVPSGSQSHGAGPSSE